MTDFISAVASHPYLILSLQCLFIQCQDILLNGFLRIHRNVSAFHGILCHLRKILICNPCVRWHSPQLKQGDSCFSHYCIGKHLTVLQCLTQCPQAIFILFPYALRYSFYLYADCICSPFFRILILAFVSRSWTAWHLGHSQIRMPRFFIRGFL